MPISKAWRLSESAIKEGNEPVIFLPVNFPMYERSSRNIFKIIKGHIEVVEQGSIDEFYFDLSFLGNFRKAEKLCKEIKERIRKEEGVTCSIGIGPNKLISKIAAGMNKPDGFLAVRQKNVELFLDPLPIRKIPGIGPKTAELIYQNNVTKIGELRIWTKDELIRLLNKHGENIYYMARGIDNSLIIEDREAKSIGEQITFEENTFDLAFIIDDFLTLCSNIFKKFKSSNFVGFKAIAITVRFSDFETKTSSRKLGYLIEKNDLKKFRIEALKLLLPFFDRRKNPYLKQVRLIGVRMEGFQN
jgi:DNA polymerase IV (DinB-like DNA polymerase)